MFSIIRAFQIKLDRQHAHLEISYTAKSNKPTYDICDLEGRIVKSGLVNCSKMRLKVNDLINSSYMLLILDGEHITSKRFQISR
jgi:hypothetical protein